jgi:cell division protein ZapA (FtsZ GTPase activity inhibitor)
MAEVEIIIGGFAHRVVCQDGQEARIQLLGQRIAREISGLAERNPGHSPTRLLLLAALHFADQADEQERQHTQDVLHGEGAAQSDAAAANQATARAQEQVLEATQLYLAQVFEEMAQRLEGLDRDLAGVEPRLPADRDDDQAC